MAKTIAQQLNIKEFPFRIKDKQGNILYYEDTKKIKTNRLDTKK
jgi:hypothetical protein